MNGGTVETAAEIQKKIEAEQSALSILENEFEQAKNAYIEKSAEIINSKARLLFYKAQLQGGGQ